MKALALESTSQVSPAKIPKTASAPVVVSAYFNQPVSTIEHPVIQRKCACGGGCPTCGGESDHPNFQTKLAISTPGDQYEQEADRVAEQVMRMPESQANGPGAGFPKSTVSGVQRKRTEPAGQPTPVDGSSNVPPAVGEALRSPGERLDPETRSFMEARFDHDFSNVRVHTNAQASASAQAIGALAFTAGRDIVFGKGQFAPSTSSGRQLLAHELAHVVQQGHSHSAARNVIQRKPTISIRDEHATGKPAKTERQATKSCPVTCCNKTLGTLHAMPILHTVGDGGPIVPAGALIANGISVALHFIAAGKVNLPPSGNDPCGCDGYHIIQVIETSHSSVAVRGNSYVDTNPSIATEPGAASPFYREYFSHGQGEHRIPNYLPNEGEFVNTTESIYDAPLRRLDQLGNRSLRWRAEACVACIKKNGIDRILGCVTYGFNREYIESVGGFAAVVAVGPGCLARPSTHFIETLGNDKTTWRYGFNTPPDANQCNASKTGP